MKPMGVSIPVPDPSSLTTEALHREIGTLRDLFTQEIKGLDAEFTCQINAINKIKEEKFDRIREHFDLIEQARLEQKADTKEKVDAALSAQKEAAAKSEQSFTKQIDAMRDLMESHSKASDEKIAALTVRVSVKDGSGAGMAHLWGLIIGAIGLAGVLVAIFKHP